MESTTAQVAEEVASHIEDVAEITRVLGQREAVGWFLAGTAFGFAFGFWRGMKWNKEKLRAEAIAEAEKDIEKIRKVYQERYAAAKAQDKPSVEKIVEEKGYSTEEPEGFEDRVSDPRDIQHLRPPVPMTDTPLTRPVQYPKQRTEPPAKDEWDFPKELASRTIDQPYVIHQDEYVQNVNDYKQVVYAYFALDQVLADEDDNIVHNPDGVVGLANLGRFGHGTDDDDVVFIRNDKLKLEAEIGRVNKSFAEDHLGLDLSDS